MRKQVRILVSGRVQGVFFRASAREEAKRRQINGFARNLPNGGVEIVGEGEEKDLKEMIAWCHKGPGGAAVEEVEIEWTEAAHKFNGFWIS